MVDKSVIEKCQKIKLVVTDIDGVWTDGTMIYSPEGEYLKVFSTYDGMGVELLRNNNIPVAIITSEKTSFVEKRAEKLQIKHVYIGIKNKMETLKSICENLSVTFDEIAYIGDDVNDLEVLSVAGFSAMPSSSPILNKFTPDYITQRPGGTGAFREFADLILSVQQKQ